MTGNDGNISLERHNITVYMVINYFGTLLVRNSEIFFSNMKEEKNSKQDTHKLIFLSPFQYLKYLKSETDTRDRKREI